MEIFPENIKFQKPVLWVCGKTRWNYRWSCRELDALRKAVLTILIGNTQAWGSLWQQLSLWSTTAFCTHFTSSDWQVCCRQMSWSPNLDATEMWITVVSSASHNRDAVCHFSYTWPGVFRTRLKGMYGLQWKGFGNIKLFTFPPHLTRDQAMFSSQNKT